jgi:hypothetical protein
MRAAYSAENFSVVRHIVLHVPKNMQDTVSVARRRQHCAYNQDCLETVITTLIYAWGREHMVAFY